MVIWVVGVAKIKIYPHYGTLDEFLMVNFDEIVVIGKLVGRGVWSIFKVEFWCKVGVDYRCVKNTGIWVSVELKNKAARPDWMAAFKFF